jgi:hypothetical protein
MSDKEQLEQAIAAQEGLRGTLDDAIIDATVAALKKQLEDLEATGQAQRRKLVTILFMDTVGSTEMASALDPEDNLAIMDTALQRPALLILKTTWPSWTRPCSACQPRSNSMAAVSRAIWATAFWPFSACLKPGKMTPKWRSAPDWVFRSRRKVECPGIQRPGRHRHRAGGHRRPVGR